MKIPPQIRIAPQVLKRYRFYMKSQHWSREQIERYQDRKLIEVVRYAGKYVPYYRKLFKEIGLNTANFRGRQDMHLIPFTDKESVRTRHDEFVADCTVGMHVTIEKTSGSTGIPLQLHIDDNSRANKAAATARAYRWAGRRFGRLGFVIKGNMPSDYGYDYVKNMIYLNSCRITEENCIAVARLLKKYKPRFWEGYATSFIDFHCVLTNLAIEIPKPSSILSYGDTIKEGMRNYIENAYQTKLFDYYSHAENVVMICQFPDNNKYLMDDYFYAEIIDSEGNKSKNGSGELVGTSFHNLAMPLIRYRTCDKVSLGSIFENTITAFQSVDNIEGRIDNYIELANGRKIYITESYTIGNFADKKIIAVQMIQDNYHHLFVNVCVEDGFRNEDLIDLQSRLPQVIGRFLDYDVRIVKTLEQNKSGKTPFIISKIGNKFETL